MKNVMSVFRIVQIYGSCHRQIFYFFLTDIWLKKILQFANIKAEPNLRDAFKIPNKTTEK